MNNRRLILYVCFVKGVAGLLFFLGFFQYTPPRQDVSSRNDLPTAVNGIRLVPEKLYRRHYARAVLIFIDAFRLNFILEENRMPFLQRHLNLSSSCVLPTKVEAPTVTLPRIKAILSGVAPGFLDVMHNLGSEKMAGDNIIDQATLSGYRIVFYGDDTWIKLFPDSFSRQEGTSSFYVNDFYEVDLNVTRNAKRELSRQDWDLMILHYLGLDHIGHVEGPYGPSVSPKLLEMDEMIEYVSRTSQQMQEESGKETLIVVTGDHGMKNSGGHGGSSAEEVMVPFILLNHCCDSNLMDSSFQQVDVTPFLSVLLGLPIPAGSSGKVSQRWLQGLKTEESLYVAFYSTQLMKNRLPLEDDDVEDHYNQAVQYYSSWLNGSRRPNVKMKAIEHFLAAQEIIATKTAKRDEVNISYVATAISLCFMALVLLVVDHSTATVFPLELLWSVLFRKKINSCLTLLALSSSIWLSSPTLLSIESVVVVVVAVTFLNTVRLLVTSRFSAKMLIGMDYLDLAFVFVFVLLPVSYLSTSFIEEEHNYWYFTFATLLVLLVYKDLGRLRSIFLILCIQLFLKKLNQTGDKWADLPDIGDWLRLTDNGVFLSFYYSISFVFGLMMAWRHDFFQKLSRRKFCNLGLLFFTGQAISIVSFRIASGQVWTSLSHSKSNGVLEVRFFWFFTALRLLYSVFYITRLERRHISRAIFSTTAQLHYSIVSLLVKPHNAVLGPSLVLFSDLLSSVVSESWQLITLHYWMGTTFFFYSGNSNSIASLDVTVGFVGLQEYNPAIAFTYGALHTYAYPILSYLLLCGELRRRKAINDRKPDDGADLLAPKFYLLLNGLPLLVYMVVIFFQREHLFIWSVFSPKLLYLLVHSILVLALVVPSSFLL